MSEQGLTIKTIQRHSENAVKIHKWVWSGTISSFLESKLYNTVFTQSLKRFSFLLVSY